MKLGKIINDSIVLVDVEDGMEVNGTRTEQDLYNDGYKKACLYYGDGKTEWIEYPTCFVEELIIEIKENE